jgi:CRP/FNR family transcriptional regulator
LSTTTLLDKHFPSFSADLVEEIESAHHIVKIPAGELMMDIGGSIEQIPLLYKGRVKIFREDEQGNELFLYHLYPGEACAISFVCSIKEKKSKIKAIAVEDSEFINVPIDRMDEFMLKFKSWYYFVLETFNFRFEELLSTVDEIAFHQMDERLVNYLVKSAQSTGTRVVEYSHQTIANELNSSREVVSRLLKTMERQGKVKLGRGRIELDGSLFEIG